MEAKKRELKTIVEKDPEKFDKRCNELLEKGWIENSPMCMSSVALHGGYTKTEFAQQFQLISK